jgi:N-acetylneuraminic acid mutarotase
MKKLLHIFIIILSFNRTYADSWTQKADLGGTIRGASAGFSIGTKGYIGTGINFSSSPAFFKDFWEWNQSTNTWTQKANFGGTARSGAIGFSIGAKGYISTGYDANIVTRDLWEYDPASNIWTQKTNYGGVGRDYAVAFSIGGKGYLGTGYNSVSTNYNDFWEYNPASNTWAQKADVPGGPRSSAAGFAINGKGYIGTGYDSGPKDDFYEYDPASNTWIQKADVPGGLRSDGAGFSIANKGYVLGGVVASVTRKDLWEYDPAANSWTQKMSLTGAAREDAVSFSIGPKGYIGTGYDPSFNRLKDFWEYGPDGLPLPVDLASFDAVPQSGSVLACWVTESETNNDFFSLEKSRDGVLFEKVAKINGHGTTSQAQKYSALDRQPFENISYYRLRQVDFNGNCTFSKIISIRMPQMEMMCSFYPNPFKNVIYINTKYTGILNVCVRDLSGKIVFNTVLHDAENCPLALKPPTLPEGYYNITITNGTSLYSQKLMHDD